MGKFTFRLFALPSWLSGAARTLDIAGQFDDYNVSDSPAEADLAAMSADFTAVADDMRCALGMLASARH